MSNADLFQDDINAKALKAKKSIFRQAKTYRQYELDTYNDRNKQFINDEKKVRHYIELIKVTNTLVWQDCWDNGSWFNPPHKRKR